MKKKFFEVINIGPDILKGFTVSFKVIRTGKTHELSGRLAHKFHTLYCFKN